MALEIGAAIATLRGLAAVVKEAGKIDLYQKVLDLQQVLLEAINENTRLAADNNRLAEEKRSLERAIASHGADQAFEFDGQVYWLGTPGEPANGPYCPRCKDKDNRRARMTDMGNGFTCCPTCQHCVTNGMLNYPKLRLSVLHRQQPPSHGDDDVW